MYHLSWIVLMTMGHFGPITNVSAGALAMGGALRIGLFAGLSAAPGCEVPVIPFGSTSWTSPRRLRKINVGTLLDVECSYAFSEQFQHIHRMHCASRDGLWEFPDDANFTYYMLNQLCINPRVEEYEPDHYAYHESQSDHLMSAFPMVLGSAFILSLLVVIGLIFRSKLRHQPRLPLTAAHSYIANAAEPPAEETERRSDAPFTPRLRSNDEFWDLSPAPHPPPLPPPCNYNPHPRQAAHYQHMAWHDRIYMDQDQLFAAYSRPHYENGLPTYEEAIKICMNSPENKEQKKESEPESKGTDTTQNSQ